MKRLSESGIEYLDYMWSPFSGCHNWKNGVCAVGTGCWAYKRTIRFKNLYPNGFEPTYYREALLSPLKLKKPSRIGMAWMGDMIGYADPETVMNIAVDFGFNSLIEFTFKCMLYYTMKHTPQHTYLILTKNPERLKLWEPFPNNCWVGCSATDRKSYLNAMNELACINAKVKFLSFEPLLSRIQGTHVLYDEFDAQQLDWIIIGQQTPVREKTIPQIEWIQEIVEAADKAKIPVFLKNNLDSMIHHEWQDNVWGKLFRHGISLRQEYPK